MFINIRKVCVFFQPWKHLHYHELHQATSASPTRGSWRGARRGWSSTRKILEKSWLPKMYSHSPGACPPPGQLWPWVPLTRPLCTHPQAHPSYSFVSCQAPQVCTGKATLVENSSCFFLCSPNDIDRVRMLIRDLTIKALIPWVEKQLKHLHEVVTNRKSRCDLESDSWSHKPLTAQGGHCPMVVVIHCWQWKLLVNHSSLHPCHWNCQILGAFSPEPNDGLEQTKEVQVGALVWCTAERRLNCRWD